MHGGDQSPVVNSPYNKYRKQISYGSPNSGPFFSFSLFFTVLVLAASKKTPSTKSASRPRDSLAKKALTNRAMSHSEADHAPSPVRPETLQFNEEKSDSPPAESGHAASPTTHSYAQAGKKSIVSPVKVHVAVEERADDILPPPSTPPPPSKEDW